MLREANLTVDEKVVTGPLTAFMTLLESSAFTPQQVVVLKAIRKKVGNRLAQRRRKAKVLGEIVELKNTVAASKQRFVKLTMEEADVILEEERMKLVQVRDQPCIT